MSIFRAYDIRGVFGEDLTLEIAEDIGKAYGTYLGGDIVVGMDNRLSSDEVKRSLIKGLISTGTNVVDVGIVPSPVLYFAIEHLKKDGCIMVTASHNPPKYNGFKLNKGNLPLTSDEIQGLKRIIDKGSYKEGKGEVSEYKVIDSYRNYIKERFKLDRKMKVVIDAGNATCGEIAPRIFRELGCDVTCIYCDMDGNFPNHQPDPTVEENLVDIKRRVIEEGADIGIAYDGDGDRVVIIDDKGNSLKGDQIMILFSRDLLKKEKGERILFEVKSSRALIKDIEDNGGVPIMWIVGHSFIKKKIADDKILLGGETSGHFFFAENFGFDDGIYASVKMAEILSRDEKTLSELVLTLPKYPSIDHRIYCSDDKKFEVVEGIKEEFSKIYDTITLDGVRVELEDGWGLVRASNTEPALVIRYEAETEEKLKEIEGIFESKLKEYGVEMT
ncbi:MAG: phosphomannomutase/phosphoglucomutase [Halobacteriota archaeon]|nr:phosphomannomutase/phosphoglucomutase [Halobacteriota archaeon]